MPRRFTDTQKAILFGLYTKLRKRRNPVRKSKFVTTLHDQFQKKNECGTKIDNVRSWVKKWNNNDGELILHCDVPKTYNSKRKRVASQIASELKKGKSLREVAMGQFDDGGVSVTLAHTSVRKCAIDLSLGPAKAKNNA